MDEGVASFLVHFSGTLVQQSGSHAYIGGKTRSLTLCYTSGFDELISKIHDRIGAKPNEARLGVKFHVPMEFFQKLKFIDIEDGEDLQAVLGMFKNSSISLGMIYVTELKPIEGTQSISALPPRPAQGAKDVVGKEPSQTSYSVDGGGDLHIPIRTADDQYEAFDRSHALKQMHKFPRTLRDSKYFSENHRKPSAVSIGPYHSTNHSLQHLELKRRMAEEFYPKEKGNKLPEFLSSFATTIKEHNVEQEYIGIENLDNETFTEMMFWDGCFILGFIECILTRRIKKLGMKNDLIKSMQKDLFLLENQLPYKVLQVLIKLVGANEGFYEEMLWKFIKQNNNFLLPQTKYRSLLDGAKPSHLLELQLRTLIGKPSGQKPVSRPRDRRDHIRLFRCVKELKGAGIKFMPNQTGFIKDINFCPYGIYGTLTIPRMIINKSTRQMIVNLIAYEGEQNESWFTSYIYFLDLLIDDAGDVKELRTAGILDCCLSSDEEVAKLFNEIGTDLEPDTDTCSGIKEQINGYFIFRRKLSAVVWLVEGIHSHFKDSWAIFALVGVYIVAFLTAVQAYFAVFSGK
ncbi:hypothetical protein L1049_001376 [Liquidambar formosana]|uniref:Uncharacterized protein n=1 Tax=Liquidambar formosana TaxID=63359 RepID=A0AAP0NEL0_LIQFO